MYVLLLPYICMACVTSSDIIPYGSLGYSTMERHCGRYSVTSCRSDVSAFDLRRLMYRPSKIDVSTFEDRCRLSKIDMSTFED